MAKPALGKGIRDLLPKNLGVTRSDESRDMDKGRILQDLNTNIERYTAQGFDVTPLKKLVEREPEIINKGIDLFRDNVKKLTGALTVLRSLEGYGFTSEIEAIVADSKDTTKADEVLLRVERLKERTIPDQGLRKETPRTRILNNLKDASRAMNKTVRERSPEFDMTDVDSLMDDLADLGSTFNGDVKEEEDEISRQLDEYEKEGFFTDRVREMISLEGKNPAEELDKFRSEIERIRVLKERLDSVDPTGIEEAIQKIRIKLPYTYMAKDIEHDIEEIEALVGAKSAKEQNPPEPEPETTREEDSGEELVHENESGPEPTGSPAESQPIPEAEETRDTAEGGPKEESTPPTTKIEAQAESTGEDLSPLSVEELLERAKDAYGAGELQGSLDLFRMVLDKDPENSKARFMIRRISQKH